MLVPTNDINLKIKEFEELWSQMRYLIKPVTKKSDDYDEKYMKIKFDSNNELPLNKTTKTPIKTIVITALFHENNKFYPVFKMNVRMKYKCKI